MLLKILLTFILFVTLGFSSQVKELSWSKGQSLLNFLGKNNIPKYIYFNLSKNDKELCAEILADVKYYVKYDKSRKIDQILIPITEQMQIHIFKNKKSRYALDFIPIEYKDTMRLLAVSITHSPYQDIMAKTNNNVKLTNEFIRAFKNSVKFKKIRKGDKLAIKYKQKIRLGKPFGSPIIIGAFVETNKRKKFIYKNEKDGLYYNDKAKSLTSVIFKTPVRYTRISSRFTRKRWHPVLKKYRAHLGIDFAAPIGRKIYATSGGKVIFRGRKGGYGNAIMIRHSYGFRSLYAHMSKFYWKVKKGSWVKQGQLIGYVGSTGMSSGPHLHFGLYKNGRPMNPTNVINITKKKLTGKTKRIFLKRIKKIKKELLAITKKTFPKK